MSAALLCCRCSKEKSIQYGMRTVLKLMHLKNVTEGHDYLMIQFEFKSITFNDIDYKA